MKVARWRMVIRDDMGLSQELDLLIVPETAEHLQHFIFPNEVDYVDGG